LALQLLQRWEMDPVPVLQRLRRMATRDGPNPGGQLRRSAACGDQQKVAVIVNEFGEVGIDNQLVVDADEEIFEMNNGGSWSSSEQWLLPIGRPIV